MRARSNNHIVPLSGSYRVHDLKLNTVSAGVPWNINIVDLESLIWDDPTGGKRLTKPCTHLSYMLESFSQAHDVFDSGDPSNLPDPRTLYENVPHWYLAALPEYRASSDFSQASLYIPVHANTTDDVGNCIFNAYNNFVNGIRALDSSVSVLESGDTPHLFDLWSRRRGAPSNIVNGFLNYSFGWRPLISDLRAVAQELRRFPSTVRRRLKAIGHGDVVRHYKFALDDTVDDVNVTHWSYWNNSPKTWGRGEARSFSVSKSRTVTITIRAKVKPKLTGESQDILDKLGTLGMIPSLATVWKISKLSFVVDWFYNIGGAIENLQGSLTHDISDVKVCVTDVRRRSIRQTCEDTGGYDTHLVREINQKAFTRKAASVPFLPAFKVPRRPVQFVLLGLLALTNTRRGKIILRTVDGLPVSKAIQAKILGGLNKIGSTIPLGNSDLIKRYVKYTRPRY